MWSKVIKAEERRRWKQTRDDRLGRKMIKTKVMRARGSSPSPVSHRVGDKSAGHDVSLTQIPLLFRQPQENFPTCM